jgi:hypothetical protein
MALKHPLKDDELLIVFEAARIALADADVFDGIAESMDLSDKELRRVREKLSAFMEKIDKGTFLF